MNDAAHPSDPMIRVLDTYRRPEAAGFEDAWVGMEPTFQTKKSISRWERLSGVEGGEDEYFLDSYLLKTQKKVVKAIKERYEAERKKGRPHCPFSRVEQEVDVDPWKVNRQNLFFHWEDESLEPFRLRFGLDPETFEYSLKPVPLAWLYDSRFVTFLEKFLWKVPQKLGLSSAMAHGGGQFSLSAKTFMGGSLLADDIAYKLSHPELSTWIMDWPNCDDRSFRATRQRLVAFKKVLRDYWAGGFHPGATGILSAGNALLDRGFVAANDPPDGLMDPHRGPIGDPREVFQTNFAFGRAIRSQAQNIHPGYWQAAHPDEDGYRPDQVMRYSEGNLNRLQIAGEVHVKSGRVLNAKRVPEFDAPLDLSMLATEASWENRAQMSRTSARDLVEALFLDVHHARYLQNHPHIAVTESLFQDQILGDGEATLKKYNPRRLDELRREAREYSLELSGGRVKGDWIEPETLFWPAWHSLPAGEKAAIAREAIAGFVERVEQAASVDPRSESIGDPMEWHRHRIHPLLWTALGESANQSDSGDPVKREQKAWLAGREGYLARRPVWSQIGQAVPPWEEGGGA